MQDNQAPWRSDEPDNRLGDEACAKMNADSPMEMYDVLCTDGRTMYAICELQMVRIVQCKYFKCLTPIVYPCQNGFKCLWKYISEKIVFAQMKQEKLEEKGFFEI